MNNRDKLKKMIPNLNVCLNFISIILITFCVYLAQPIRSSHVIFIPQGSSSKIITHLRNNGFDLGPLDGLIVRMFGYPQSGWIDIQATSLSRGDFLYRITKAKAALQNLTLIPGETMYFFIQQIAQEFNLSTSRLHTAFLTYSPLPDGVILANTYKVPRGISENALMNFLVSLSLKEHKALSEKVLGEFDEQQWFKYVTIASIIQKEAANVEEMPLISAVIRNRLALKMPLQMDGTLNYGPYSHTKVTPQMIRDDKTSFNTYKNTGLPKSPVGSVSFAAIKAAIFPANVDYLYFVRNKNGTHNFSRHYEQHLKNFSK